MQSSEELYLFIPNDVTFMHPDRSGAVVRESVPVDPLAMPEEGDKIAMKIVPVIRSFLFFNEEFIVSHPIFSIQRGAAVAMAGLRIIDTIDKATKGKWQAFKADDVRLMRQTMATPPSPKDDKKKPRLSAAEFPATDFSFYHLKQYRTFIESIMNPRTSPPEEVEEKPELVADEREEAVAS